MFKTRRQAMIWGGVLSLLLLANLAIHWPREKRLREDLPPPFLTEIPDEKAISMINDGIGRLPEEKQAEARRVLEDHITFMKSVKDLPEKERLAKVQEHLASSPMPFLPPPPDEDDALPDTPGADTNAPTNARSATPPPKPSAGGGGPGSGRIPPPEVRYNFDKEIAGEQEKEKQGKP